MLRGEERIKILKRNGWELLPTQKKIIGANARKIFLAGGRGYGKSLAGGLFLFAESLINPDYPERRLYWICANQFDNTQYVFEYVLKEYHKMWGGDWRGFAKEKPSIPERGSWTLKLKNNVVIETRSWGNLESLHQKKVHGIIIDEGGLLDRWAWEMRLVPSVGKTRDSWLFMVGTWEEAGILQKELYEQWQTDPEAVVACAPSWENYHEYPGGENDPTLILFKSDMSPEAWQERFAAQPRKPARLVYPEFELSVHCGSHEYIPGQAVYLAVDPGTQTGCVLAIQEGDDGAFYVIDEIYEEDWSTEAFKEEVADREWFEDLAGGTIDDKAPDQQRAWRSATAGGGFGVNLTKRSVKVLAGIERVKTFLFCQDFAESAENIFEKHGTKGIPKIFFNTKTCRNTIKEFRQYSWKKTAPRAGDPRAPTKKHDHACNAIAYFLIGMVGFVKVMRRAPTRRPDKYRHI